MSMLLPQTRTGVVVSSAPVDIHGDRFFDVTLAFDGANPDEAPLTSRVSATECPAGLAVGERVAARLVLGIITRITRP